MSARSLRCFETFLDRDLGAAIGQILPNRASKEERILEDNAENIMVTSLYDFLKTVK